MEKRVKLGFATVAVVKTFLLALFSLMLLLFLSIDYGPFLKDTLKMSLIGCWFVLVSICLSLSVYGLIAPIRFFLDPYRYFIAKLGVRRADSSLQQYIEDLSRKIRVPTPVLLLTESPLAQPDIFAFGLSKWNSFIVASPSLLKSLDDDESAEVFLHEMYHIKQDTELQSLDIVFRKAFQTPVNMVVMLLALLASELLYVVIFGVHSLAMNHAVYNALKLIVIILIGLGLFGIVMALVLLEQFGSIVGGRYAYIREMFADSYSAISSDKPLKLYSAVVKAWRMKRRAQLEARVLSSLGLTVADYDRISFVQSSREQTKIKDDLPLSSIFKTRLLPTFSGAFGLRGPKRETSCPIEYRLSLLKNLENLVHGSARVRIVETKSHQALGASDSRPATLSAGILLGMPESVVDLLKAREPTYREFLDYMEEKASSFNLIECARFLKVEPFEAFLMLFAAVHSGIADIDTNSAEGKHSGL